MRQKHNIQPKLRGSFSGHQFAEELKSWPGSLRTMIVYMMLSGPTESANSQNRRTQHGRRLHDQGGHASKTHGRVI